ncbi:MAG: P-loop NTPase fold protein, partial [Pseudomonadota bacterium]
MKTDIIKAIQTYLDRDKAQYAIMINGSWGIGKTHFIQNEVIPAAGSIEFVYLSLYGLNSLEKLESLLQTKLAEISSRSQQSDKVQSLSRASALSAKSKPVLVQGSFDSSELSVRNQVLCFDDLERWSGDLDQCLSYINQLVEQENYKCLVIGNIDEISKTGMQAFANAREKTIRHVYQFENSYQSIFEVALGLPNYSSKASERFLRSLVRDNRVTLQRLLDRVSVRNIRTVSEAFQLYEYVLRRNSALFRGNRNLAFAYLMALQSALILVNRYLLDRDHRDQLMKQDHDEGKGFKYLSEIGYFDGKASGFLTEQARFLLDTIFYRMDQISLKGLFSIVRNGFYVKSDFVGNFDNWRKEQQYDTYLDKEK